MMALLPDMVIWLSYQIMNQLFTVVPPMIWIISGTGAIMMMKPFRQCVSILVLVWPGMRNIWTLPIIQRMELYFSQGMIMRFILPTTTAQALGPRLLHRVQSDPLE